MRPRDFLPAHVPLRLMAALVTLLLVIPGRVDASTSGRYSAGAGTPVTISFGRELGNIRPFRVTITGKASIKLNGPIHLAGVPRKISKDAVAGLVLLAEAEGFRSLPSFTACPGVLPDVASRYINIHAPTWQHRASARGNCLDSINQLFAVLMDAAHASF
jgi:hypothetical protein